MDKNTNFGKNPKSHLGDTYFNFPHSTVCTYLGRNLSWNQELIKAFVTAFKLNQNCCLVFTTRKGEKYTILKSDDLKNMPLLFHRKNLCSLFFCPGFSKVSSAWELGLGEHARVCSTTRCQ